MAKMHFDTAMALHMDAEAGVTDRLCQDLGSTVQATGQQGRSCRLELVCSSNAPRDQRDAWVSLRSRGNKNIIPSRGRSLQALKGYSS